VLASLLAQETEVAEAEPDDEFAPAK
jgi:hypothetical protein